MRGKQPETEEQSGFKPKLLQLNYLHKHENLNSLLFHYGQTNSSDLIVGKKTGVQLVRLGVTISVKQKAVCWSGASRWVLIQCQRRKKASRWSSCCCSLIWEGWQDYFHKFFSIILRCERLNKFCLFGRFAQRKVPALKNYDGGVICQVLSGQNAFIYRPGKEQSIFQCVLICDTLKLKESALTFFNVTHLLRHFHCSIINGTYISCLIQNEI